MKSSHYTYTGLESQLSSNFVTSLKNFGSYDKIKSFNDQFIRTASTKFNSTDGKTQTCDNNIYSSSNTYIPRGLEQTLSAQSCNIVKVKIRIQKQKNYLNNSFQILSTEIAHILEDFKLSIYAKLDIQYQQYLIKYASLKNQVQAFQMNRKLIKMQSTPSLITTPIADNRQLIAQLKRAEEQYKQAHIRKQLIALQPAKNIHLQNLISQILIIAQRKDPFINHQRIQFRQDQIKNIVNRYIEPLYGDLNQFILKRQLSNLKQTLKVNTNFENTIPSNHYSKQSLSYDPKVTHPEVIEYVPISMQTIKYKQSTDFMVVQPQNLVIQKATSLNITDNYCVRSLHTDITLCSVGFKNQVITGGKDAIVTVNSLDGEKVITLRGHQASVCCISIINSGKKTYVASGGDLNCGHVILWLTDKWGMFVKILAHKAAISSIIDARDSSSLITSSYDKSIKVINYLNSQIVHTQNCQKPVIGLVMNSDKSLVVSCHLSQTLNIWQVLYNKGVVNKLQLKNKIENNYVVSSILSSMTDRQILISGDKKGFVKIWNLVTGSCLNSYKCHECLVVDMVIIDRLNKKNNPFIISCGNKDKSLSLIDTQTNRVREINLKNQINIALGCGIGPKMFWIMKSPTLQLGLVSQSVGKKQVQICDVQLFKS